MGAVVLLLIVPLVLFLLGELFARFSLFGFSAGGASEPVQSPSSTPPGRIVRQPDLPPRLALHERSRCRIVVQATGPGGEPTRSFLRA
ncbi:MAG: hypothetical protein OET44_04420 [Gammaproteobacteria bacterium]|nr:hypothetical protein [Gammaproteobacteria bacterium]